MQAPEPNPKHPVDELFDFGLEKWYPVLKEHTFESEWLDLSWEEIPQVEAIVSSRNCVQIRGGRSYQLQEVPAHHKAAIAALTARIDAVLERVGPSFVKLNTRSPKDSCYDLENAPLCSLLERRIKELYASPTGDAWLDRDDTESEQLLTNEEMIIFFQSANERLRAANGKEAMELFLLSDRINQDLAQTLTYRTGAMRLCPAKLVIRKWIPMPLEAEFRAFVNNGKLTAVSQYYHFIVFPKLLTQRTKIFARIQAAFAEIGPKIPYPSYCVDFGVFPDRVRVIELNPFGDRTGACNFSWKKGPAERKVLTDVTFYDAFIGRLRAKERQVRGNRAAIAKRVKVLAAVSAVLALGTALYYARSKQSLL